VTRISIQHNYRCSFHNHLVFQIIADRITSAAYDFSIRRSEGAQCPKLPSGNNKRNNDGANRQKWKLAVLFAFIGLDNAPLYQLPSLLSNWFRYGDQQATTPSPKITRLIKKDSMKIPDGARTPISKMTDAKITGSMNARL